MQIKAVIANVFQGFRDLAIKANVDQTVNRVESTLDGLVAPVFDALARFLNPAAAAVAFASGLGCTASTGKPQSSLR